MDPKTMAIFAGGCFWCTEAAFAQLTGVSEVESGYVGGLRETANYQDVCGGDTGHAEAIRITFEPATISYDQLLEVFFDAHDPTQLNRQGNDVGTQYRSAIFPVDEEQRKTAEAKIEQIRSAYPRPIATRIEPLIEFFPAEDYHQDYADKNSQQPYIRSHAIPQACKVRDKHPELMRGKSPS